MSKTYVGDVGTEIILDCVIDISTATVLKIFVRKPDSTATVEWNAVAEGTTKIKHVAADGDLNYPGTYTVQAYIKMPLWKGRGEATTFTVNNLFT